MLKQVFLGGTCGNNNWREEIVIPGLLERGVALESLFNPVVKHWDAAAQACEDLIKRTADYNLFVLTNPDKDQPTANVSAYSLIEAVMGLYDDPERTVVVFETSAMAKHTGKAMDKACRDLRQRFPDAPIFDLYQDAINYLAERL